MGTKRAGFTLIELSICLIIIGLVVGGILVGRDLIRASELRGDISAVQKVNLAVQAFRSKYDCQPGDCADASEVLSGALDGDGNGRIDTPSTTPCGESQYYSTEHAQAVDHLARAGMIDNTPFDVDSPTEAVTIGKGIIPIRSSADQGIVFGCGITLGGVCSAAEPYECSFIRLGAKKIYDSYVSSLGLYRPADAYYVDGKLDDGLPASGRVMFLPDWGDVGMLFANAGYETADNECLNDLSAISIYNINSSQYRNRQVCTLRVKADF
jgi:prepilin-type N-terminal cleavage/methylation domain-containing protein